MTYQEAIKILKAKNICYKTTVEKCEKIAYCTDCKGFTLREEGAKANEVAIEVLEKTEYYRWHDIRKNPKDLPCGKKAVVMVACECTIGRYGHYIDIVGCCDGKFDVKEDTVIAWRWIEGFEEE